MKMNLVEAHIRSFTAAGQAAEVKRSMIEEHFEGFPEKAMHLWARDVVRCYDLKGWSYSMASDSFRFEPKTFDKRGHLCF